MQGQAGSNGWCPPGRSRVDDDGDVVTLVDADVEGTVWLGGAHWVLQAHPRYLLEESAFGSNCQFGLKDCMARPVVAGF